MDEITDEELAEMIEWAKGYVFGRCLAANRYGEHVPSLIAALRASRTRVKELELLLLEANNPGIDMEEVKRLRRG